jgi:hypothetical protein
MECGMEEIFFGESDRNGPGHLSTGWQNDGTVWYKRSCSPSLSKVTAMEKIPPFRLVPEPLNEEARHLPKFQSAPKEIGTRHKLGGEPDFLQNAEWPSCPSCDEKMTFYGQLDSISDEICIADCGMIYVFLCFDCFEAAAFAQSY